MAAIIGYIAMKDIKIWESGPKKKTTSVIDRSKIRRARRKVRKDLQRKSSKGQILLYDLSEVQFEDLSTDQQYMYKICDGISKGNISVGLKLATANRILGFCISRENPSRNLAILAEETKQNSEVRAFEIPPINYDADDYTGLINWLTTKITEPPLTKQISNDDLKRMITNVPEEIDILKVFLPYPSVREVNQLVTEASAIVAKV
ncbi:hypothetical protein ILUMI_16978 [Ignelater luminosus]|uniref:Uncharacterized protein n=1 Tax=Ignelater luminosus TaxID=2038154 RepID=A0A8K0CTA3_IGNLU|nr:hypothetical protein ILUMI_16978 [Ignelater luminosus]